MKMAQPLVLQGRALTDAEVVALANRLVIHEVSSGGHQIIEFMSDARIVYDHNTKTRSVFRLNRIIGSESREEQG